MGKSEIANPKSISAPYGFQGIMFWTYASAETEANWAEWRPFLPEAGQWQVWVFIPENQATTTNARYRIVHADGRAETAVNQSEHSNEWVLLGVYRFEPRGGYQASYELLAENLTAQGIDVEAVKATINRPAPRPKMWLI